MADATDGQVSRPNPLRCDRPVAVARHPRLHWLVTAAVCVAVCAIVAVCFDASVASWVHQKNLQPLLKKSIWADIVKLPGNYLKGTLPIAALALLTSGRRRGGYAASLILLSGVLAGLFYTLAKWCAGRTRPYSRGPIAHPFEFHPFIDGLKGLWTANNQAFPSGHTCLAFSTATALTMLWPRAAALFFIWPVLIGVERVLENAHYPSDVVAGATFGIIAACLAYRALRPLAEQLKIDPGVGHG